MKITAIIPAFNCEATIAPIVRVALLYCENVIVVDDCSSDNTNLQASDAGAITIQLTENQGKAAAMWRGIDFAMLTGFDVLVTIDADGEHDPNDIPLLVRPIDSEGCSVVFGVRDKTHGSGTTGNHRPTQTMLIHHFNIGLRDAMCGYRAYSYNGISILRKYLHTRRFGIDFELTVLTVLLGLRFVEITVSTADLREYGGIRASHFDGLAENIQRFAKHHNFSERAGDNWLLRINARDSFYLPIGNNAFGFMYSPNDQLYYRK